MTLREMLMSAGLLSLLTCNAIGQGLPNVIWESAGHTNAVRAITWSHDGSTIASGAGYDDSSLKLWNAADGALLTTLSGHANGILSVDFSPDDQFLAAGFIVSGYPPGGVMKLWDLETETVLHEFPGCFVAFSPDGQYVASGGGGVGRDVYVHRVSDGEEVLRKYTGSYLQSIAFSPGGDLVATGNSHNEIKLWSISANSLVRTITGHTDDIQALAFSPDGATLASGAGGFDDPGESTIKLWDVATGNLLRTLDGHGDWVSDLEFSGDGDYLVSTGRDGVYPNVNAKIKVWDPATGDLVRFFDDSAQDIALPTSVTKIAYGRNSVVVAAALFEIGTVDDLVIQRVGENIRLDWSEVSGASSYSVFWVPTMSGDPVLLDETATTTFTHTDPFELSDTGAYSIVAE